MADIEKHLDKAEKYASKGKFLDAVEEYAAAYKQAPNNLDYLRLMGDLSVRGGKNEKALGYYGELFDKYCEKNDATRAVPLFRKSLQSVPQPPERVARLGLLLQRSRKNDEAAEAFRSALDLFQKAGLNVARPPATEEQMVNAARTIKQRTQAYGFMPLIDGTRLMHRFRENGLPMLSADGKRAVFNTPAHVAYLQRNVDLFKQDYFPEDTLRRGFTGAVERYSAGQLGMLLVGPQFLLRIKESNPEVYAKTSVAPYPMGRGHVIHAGLMTLTVPKASTRQQEALKFALYVTNDANQLQFSKQSVVFPSTKQAAADPYFRQGGAGPEWQARAIAVDELKFGRDLTVVVPNQSELYKIFREAVESAFFGKMSAKEALDWAVREWNARL